MTIDPGEQRGLLLADERLTRAQREALTRDLGAIVAATSDVATDDEHDPEGATIAWERQRTAALIEQVDVHLAEIQRALARLEAGTYGTCEQCDRSISPERLEARPTVRLCIDCAASRHA